MHSLEIQGNGAIAASSRASFGAVVVLCAGILARPCTAQEMAWDGTCGGNSWHSICGPGGSQTNWSPDGIPTLANTVSIPAGSPAFVLLGQPGFAFQINCDTGLCIDNTTLQLGPGGGTITGLQMSNTFSTIQFVDPGSAVSLANDTTWTVGTVQGPGTVFNLGSLNAAVAPQAMTLRLIGSGTFSNAGEATFRFVSIDPGCEAVNQGGGTFKMHSDAQGGSLTGPGVFSNAGTFVVDCVTSSSKRIDTFFSQTSGQLVVQGVPNVLNAWFTNAGHFSGGSIVVNDDCNLRFQHPGGEPLPYVFDGLSSITGSGNVFVEIPSGAPVTADWQVTQPLVVDLNGSEGFVMAGNRITLGADLTNIGAARWLSATIRPSACGDCEPRFVNESTSFVLDTGCSNCAVNLDTVFLNEAIVTHAHGVLNMRAGGRLLNGSQYDLVRGSITESTSNAVPRFVNSGLFVKPDHDLTQDSTVAVPFRNEQTVRCDRGVLSFTRGVGLIEARVEVGRTATVELDGSASTAEGPAFSVITGEGVFRMTDCRFRALEAFAGVSFEMTGDGRAKLASGAALAGVGTFLNKGHFEWDDGSLGVQATAEFGIFHNEGQVWISGMDGFTNSEYVNASGASTCMRGSIAFAGSITNNGAWTIEASGSIQLSGGPAAFWNQPSGVLLALPGILPGSAQIDVSLTNDGTVHVKPGMSLFVNDTPDLQDGKLLRGTWIVEPGGTLALPRQLTGIEPNVRLTANTSSLRVLNLASNRGTVDANGTVQSTGDILNNGGTLIAGPGPLHTPGTIDNTSAPGESLLSYTDYQPPISVAGGPVPPGFVCSVFNNGFGGVIRPGGSDTPGPFALQGDLEQHGGGTIEIELGGLAPVAEHDQVSVDGDVGLGGTLHVKILPGFTPRGGEQFTILTASNGRITGVFEHIAGGGQYSIQYDPGSVVLTLVAPPLIGDATNDGVVNVDDLLSIIIGWGACPAPPIPGSCPADVNADGVVNVDDLVLVITNWGG